MERGVCAAENADDFQMFFLFHNTWATRYNAQLLNSIIIHRRPEAPVDMQELERRIAARQMRLMLYAANSSLEVRLNSRFDHLPGGLRQYNTEYVLNEADVTKS